MNEVFLLLGSNLDDRKKNLLDGVKLLEEIGLKVIERSSIYETEPWGVSSQPAFFNQAIGIKTQSSPEELLVLIKEIEIKLGRTTTERWGERIIDIDILYYNDLITQLPHLVIPHPELPNRKFALIPLNEIAPGHIHPILKKTTLELLHSCRDILAVSKVD